MASFDNTLGCTYAEIGQFAAYARRRIAPHRDGRVPVIYPFAAVDMLGHVWFDGHALKTVYPPAAHQVFFFRPPLPPGRPRRLFDLATRGFEVVEVVDDFPLANLARLARTVFHDQHAFAFGDLTMAFGGASHGIRALYRAGARGRPHRPTLALNEAEETEGAGLADRLGLDRARPLVVVHAREPGYNRANDYNRFRDCDIATYRPAIAALAASGYSLVRIGDPSMSALGLEIPHVHDSTRPSLADPLLDAWLISHAAFVVHCLSGPTDIARAFARPRLCVNGYAQDYYPAEAGEAFLFKHIAEVANGRQLDLAEIVGRRFTQLWNADQLTRQGLRMIDNDAAEIEAACLAYAAALSAGPAPQPRYEAFCRMEAELRRAAGGTLPEHRDWPMDAPGSTLAPVFLERQPDFLDRDPPPIATRPPPPEPMSLR